MFEYQLRSIHLAAVLIVLGALLVPAAPFLCCAQLLQPYATRQWVKALIKEFVLNHSASLFLAKKRPGRRPLLEWSILAACLLAGALFGAWLAAL